MILREVKELIDEALKTKKEAIEKGASQEEIDIIVSEVLFKLDILLNGINYSLMQQ